MKRLRAKLTAARDPASLAFFRIGVGLAIAWDAWQIFDSGALRRGFVLPRHHFTWWLFGWVRPHHGIGAYLAFLVMGIAGLMLAAGFRYRLAAVLAWAGVTYTFLVDKALYLNHHYLAILIAFLLIFLPADAAWSVDARRRPGVAKQTIPAWPIYLLRFQVAIPYFFGGIAKLNYDWLVRGEPLRMWLANRTDFPVIGPLFVHEPVVRMMSAGSLLIDLVGPFLLLYKRTRVPMFGLALTFHFLNSRLFGIGMFPWMMIIATTIFFEPDWPRRMIKVLRGGTQRQRTAILVAFVVAAWIAVSLRGELVGFKALVGGFGAAFFVFHLVERRDDVPPYPPETPPTGTPLPRRLAAFLAVWALIQIAVPLRHFVIPGHVQWTQEGSRFAWHMLLNQFVVRNRFIIRDPRTRERWVEDVAGYVEPKQWSRTYAPDMFLQLAHFMEDYYREQGRGDVEVRLHSTRSMNGRPNQLYLDPKVDLTKIERPYISPAHWIMPLRPPPPRVRCLDVAAACETPAPRLQRRPSGNSGG